jgi:hypothetical protein
MLVDQFGGRTELAAYRDTPTTAILYSVVDFIYQYCYEEDSLEFSLISEETEFEPTKVAPET